MKRFENIDAIIEQCAFNLNARLSKDRPEYPEVLRTFEERRIDWTENGIRKAIIIQPMFEAGGVNQNLWNLTNIAWSDETIPHPTWRKSLVTKKDYSLIEHSINELLYESVNNLSNIQLEDLYSGKDY